MDSSGDFVERREGCALRTHYRRRTGVIDTLSISGVVALLA
jgi:hypothetical protein